MKKLFLRLVILMLSVYLAGTIISLYASEHHAPAPTPTPTPAPPPASPAMLDKQATAPYGYDVPVPQGWGCCHEDRATEYIPRDVYEAQQKKKAEEEEMALLAEIARSKKEKEEAEKLKRGDPEAVARAKQDKIDKENNHWMSVRDKTLANIEYNSPKELRELRNGTDVDIGSRRYFIDREQAKGDQADHAKIRQWIKEIHSARQNFETRKKQIQANERQKMQEAKDKYNAKYQGGNPPEYRSSYSREDYKLNPDSYVIPY